MFPFASMMMGGAEAPPVLVGYRYVAANPDGVGQYTSLPSGCQAGDICFVQIAGSSYDPAPFRSSGITGFVASSVDGSLGDITYAKILTSADVVNGQIQTFGDTFLAIAVIRCSNITSVNPDIALGYDTVPGTYTGTFKSTLAKWLIFVTAANSMSLVLAAPPTTTLVPVTAVGSLGVGFFFCKASAYNNGNPVTLTNASNGGHNAVQIWELR